MILRKKKVQKFEAGGSVGFYPKFQVNLPQEQIFDPSVLFQRYGSSSGRSRSSGAAAKSPKPKNLAYDFKNGTKGATRVFDQIVGDAIQEVGALNPSSLTYATEFELKQKDIKNLGAKIFNDATSFKESAKAVSPEQNNSGDAMTLFGGNVFVVDKESNDVKPIPYVEYMKKDNQKKYGRPLNNNQFLQLKDNATTKRFSSLLLDRGLNTNEILKHNLGLDKLSASFDKVFKGAGKITSKDGTLLVGGDPVSGDLLKGIIDTGKVPSEGLQSNEKQLATAMEQVNAFIAADSRLNDSLTSQAITALQSRGVNIDTSTEEGVTAFGEALSEERNKIIANSMRKHLNIKIGGTGDGTGDGGVSGTGVIGEASIALIGDEKDINLGELVQTDKAKAEFSGIVAKGVNLSLDGDLRDEAREKSGDSKEIEPLTINESKELSKWTGADKVYTFGGVDLGARAADNLVIDIDKPVYRLSVPVVNGQINLTYAKKARELLDTPETNESWKVLLIKAESEKVKRTGSAEPLSTDEIKSLREAFEASIVPKTEGVTLQPMIALYAHSTDEAPFYESIKDSPFINKKDLYSDELTSDVDKLTSFWGEEEFGLWVILPARGIQSVQAKDKGAQAAKSQLTLEALEKTGAQETRTIQ